MSPVYAVSSSSLLDIVAYLIGTFSSLISNPICSTDEITLLIRSTHSFNYSTVSVLNLYSIYFQFIRVITTLNTLLLMASIVTSPSPNYIITRSISFLFEDSSSTAKEIVKFSNTTNTVYQKCSPLIPQVCFSRYPCK